MGVLDQIRLIVFDVDGVLTDGVLQLDDQGVEAKRFHVRDGLAIRAALASGLKVAVLSARRSPAVSRRMEELGVELLVEGSTDKSSGLNSIIDRAGISLGRTAYLGDDLLDLPAMVRCGYPMAVSDAVEEVLAVAEFVTTVRGGLGAAREAVEHILKAQGKWKRVVDSLTAGT